MPKLRSVVVCSILVCTSWPAVSAMSDAERAARVTRDAVVVDTHIDVPYRLREKWADVTSMTDTGDFDHPRARFNQAPGQ